VGLGTFRGIDTGDVRDYVIHGEIVEIEKDLLTRIATMKHA
jgi:S-adenosylmethionine:tRNA-ribosyltransferase-isomerase (queuine synthetase)